VVNEGVLEICKQFLETPEYEETFISKLQETMKEFLHICEEMLDINKTMIAANQIEFHEALVEGYHKLANEMSKYTHVTGEKIRF
jgi:hypothetical protein